ncbi:hypothetical protein FOL46_007220 [Perkinsus olseni]|uniref:3'-5' exonuclease n=1 Tax=Perkinsus olseni TaxID=32597 RepID=A0A7J6MX23_PEROL|nr:hypothetical protein FOL46_007220 [Perkinsus olseni]
MPQYDTYGGPIYIIDGCDDDVEFCEENLYGRSFVGIDFEWDRELRGQRNQIELVSGELRSLIRQLLTQVQIATPTDGVFLFRCLPGEPLHPVATSILTDWNITKVCSGYDNGDCARLWETYSIEVPRESLLDMHDEARDRGLQRYGLKGMCEDCGYAIYKPKNPNFFYWSRNFLKKSQIRYAAADAWFPLLVAGYWDVLDLDVSLSAGLMALIFQALIRWMRWKITYRTSGWAHSSRRLRLRLGAREQFPLSGGSRLSGGDGDLTEGMAVPMLPRAAVCSAAHEHRKPSTEGMAVEGLSRTALCDWKVAFRLLGSSAEFSDH